MNLKNTIAIVLAAGQGKRMNSNLPKVAHLLSGKPLIYWVIESLIASGIRQFLPVISPTQKLVEEIVLNTSFSAPIHAQIAYQDVQKGTAHAVSCAIDNLTSSGFLKNSNLNEKELKIIVAYGDTPAIQSNTFKKLIQIHEQQNNNFTILGFETENPTGYGRILVNEKNEFVGIREHKDCNLEELKIKQCNSGILCANYLEIKSILPLIKNENAANEFYLTDVPIIAIEQKLRVGLLVEKDELQFLGINTQEQLMNMENELKNGFPPSRE